MHRENVKLFTEQNILNRFIKKELQIAPIFEKLVSNKLKISAYFFDFRNFDIKLFRQFNIYMPNVIRQSVSKRQAEFLAGRIMAKQALTQLGIATTTIAIGDNRCPIWPSGVKASISHSHNIAICIAGASSVYSYIGCDVEAFITDEMQVDICDLIINESERLLIDSVNIERNIAFTLVFSAKESLFKALYPSVQGYFDFNVAQILTINSQNKTFEVVLLDSLTKNLLKGMIFKGSYALDDEFIITFIIQ